jgi:hypothetical protein
MPYIANTPESILPRSDSRNPATTCRGITVSGRPCRRPLASSAQSPPSKGVVAVLTGKRNASAGQDAAAFYCWQHRDQAGQFVGNAPEKGRAEILPIQQRTSIDTLVERLGVLDVNEEKRAKSRQDGPGRYSPNVRSGNPKSRHHTSQQRRSSPGEATFCCFRIMDDDDLPASRPVAPPVDARRSTASYELSASQPRPVVVRRPHSSPHTQVVQQRPIPTTPERWPASRQSLSPYHTPPKPGHSATPTRPSLPSTPASSSSQTQPLLSWIPAHLSPQTTALLLTELAKPISDADEQGYIYIFWVTPSTSNSPAPPPDDIASSLLPSPNRPNQRRRTSDALRVAQSQYATTRGSDARPGTIRLKIGRTSNVHRRLNEWSRQCSHNLTLIRYYPYSSSSSPSPSPARTSENHTSQETGRQVPHVRRVERLIHVELAERKIKGQGRCAECGKEHREWFEVEATKDALRLVDDCVRRWVSWGERHE